LILGSQTKAGGFAAAFRFDFSFDLSGIQSESDLHCNLPMRNLVILKVAA
jgi:hypothetical protein